MVTDNRTCYFPDGGVAVKASPCTSDDVTHCCGPGAICLTNGYCLDWNQPYVLSRDACTSDTWASGCPTQCQDVSAYAGCSIINYSFKNNISEYCCGTPTYNGSAITCANGADPFQVSSGSIILGRAALANVTNTTSTSTSNTTVLSTDIPTTTGTASASSSSSHDVAIGAGVGVPLGVAALGALLWGFWERRRANSFKNMYSAIGTPLMAGRGPVSTNSGDTKPRELDPQHPVAELMGRE